MREVELTPPSGDVQGLFEQIATGAGLEIRSRGTLASYPGCIHWHLGKQGAKGTLEATWWPARSRLWLKLHHLREAAWIPKAIDIFVDRFKNAPSKPQT